MTMTVDPYANADFTIKVIVDVDGWGHPEYAVMVLDRDGNEVEEYGCDGSLNRAMIGAAKIIRAAPRNKHENTVGTA